jgi:hypothetical protein
MLQGVSTVAACKFDPGQRRHSMRTPVWCRRRAGRTGQVKALAQPDALCWNTAPQPGGVHVQVSDRRRSESCSSSQENLMTRINVALGVLLLGTGLLGCASKTALTNPNVASNVQQHQFTLDSAQCVAEANATIPEPAQPQAQQGTVTLNTPSGPVHGSYRSEPQRSASPGFDAFQAGRRKAQRRGYAEACMSQRGWRQGSPR